MSSVKTWASGAIFSSRSRTTEASFWNEHATARRGWKRSTMKASTPLASRCSRSGATVAGLLVALIHLKGTKSDRDIEISPGGHDRRVASILQVTMVDDARPSAPGAVPDDAEALDAYSRVVTGVAETLGPVGRQPAGLEPAPRHGGRRLRRRDHAGRLHAHQRARRRRHRRARARLVRRRQRPPGEPGRLRPAVGPRGPARRRRGPAARRARRRRRAARRPARRGDRQPARLRGLGDRRRGVGARPLAAGPRRRRDADHRRRDPDRRRAEPRQLRRRAGRRPRPRGRASTPPWRASASASRCRSTRRRAGSSPR